MMRTLALLMLAGMASAKLKPITSYFDVCSRNQNKEMLSECVKNSIEKAKIQLIKGIPDLKLLPIDPLSIDKMEMKENSGRFKFDQTLTDLKIYGLSNAVIKDFSMDLDNLSFKITSFTPHIQMEASYVMDGQVMVVPIKGSGHASYNFTDVTSEDSVTFKKVKRNGKTYLTVHSYKLRIEPKGAHSYFSNLFNGDKRLGDATNNFLNENWYEAFNSFRSLPEKAFGDFFRNQLEQVCKLYTFDEIFPEKI
uniref:Protein takeout n=2 Tax=Lygus hesperus TaxID=30085 RepID=A0A0A9WER5_LYGHE